MIQKRPLSAGGLFTTPADMYGWYDEEPDNNLIVRGNGSNQFLGDFANQHDSAPNVTSRSNRVQDGRLPSPMSRPRGTPSQAHPLGLTQND